MTSIEISEPAAQDATERLLQDLIVECRHMIREMVLPFAAGTDDTYERSEYLAAAVDLVRIGAVVGDAIARLRAGAAGGERRQRILLERVEPLTRRREGEL